MLIIKQHLAIIIIVFVLFIVHSILAIIPPLNSDEALYWEHSRHLALGYYSHPPLTGWLIAAITYLFGTSEYSIRFISIALHLCVIFIIYVWTNELTKEKKISCAAVIIFSLMPVPFFFGSFVTSDCSLFFFYTISTYFVYKAIFSESAKYWYIAGFAAGGMMLSKFMGFLFFPSVFLFLIVYGKYRYQLLQIHPYFAFIITLSIFSPFLYWNSQNQWLTFQFNFFARNQNAGLSLLNFIYSFLAQIIALSPFVFFSFLYLMKNETLKMINKYNGHINNHEYKKFFLWIMIGFPFIFYFMLSFFVIVNPHYIGIVLPLISIVLAQFIYNYDNDYKYIKVNKKKLSIWISSSLFVLVPFIILISFPKIIPDRYLYIDSTNDPNKQVSHIFGWQQIGSYLDKLITRYSKLPNGLFIAAPDYGLASTLAFNTPSKPDIYLINYPKDGFHGKEYLIWEKNKKKIGYNMIYITDRSKKTFSKISAFFKKTKYLPSFVIKDEKGILRVFHILIGYHYIGGEPDRLSVL